MTPILVSAFLHNKQHYQTADFYKQYGTKILQINQRKIIFMDENLLSAFSEYQNEYTTFLPIKQEDMYLYPYLDSLEHGADGNKNKDSNFFFSIMCNKTEWIRQAIELQLYEGDQYIWIDFGIFKIFDKHVDLSCLEHSYEKVRIGHIWNLEKQYKIDITKKISWYFAGGLFGGHKDRLIEFANIMKKTTLEFIKKHNYLVWEVNIWYMLYLNNKDLFDPYLCDHNNSMVNRY